MRLHLVVRVSCILISDNITMAKVYRVSLSRYESILVQYVWQTIAADHSLNVCLALQSLQANLEAAVSLNPLFHALGLVPTSLEATAEVGKCKYEDREEVATLNLAASLDLRLKNITSCISVHHLVDFPVSRVLSFTVNHVQHGLSLGMGVPASDEEWEECQDGRG